MSAQPQSPASGGFLVGQVGGAPVRIGYSWLVLAVVVVVAVAPNVKASRPDLGTGAYAVGLAVALVLLVAVLAHEFAHALVARAFGARVVAIVADLFGGHTSFDGRALGPGRSAAVAFAGPLTNGLLGGIFYLFTSTMDSGVPLYLLDKFALVNIYLAGFNLLPGLPLDGGQLVESAVWAGTGNRHKGTVVSAWCGRIVTILVVLWWVVLPIVRGQGLGPYLLWGLLLASFLWRGASSALTRGQVLGRIDRVALSQLIVALPVIRETDSVELAAARAPGGAIVLSAADQPIGLVLSDAVAQVPVDRRAGTTVGAILVRQPYTWVIDATSEDALPVVQELAQRNIPIAVVRREGRLIGVIQAGDVERVLTGGSTER
ncbi:MAG: M50 family metallopeptidase [Nostocoides sp.]